MNDRRLIEEYLPVAEVSYESTREKLLRRRDYHISTLHLWWARRPLAASRAAVYAALTDAPSEIDAAGLAAKLRALCAWRVADSAVREARGEILAANGGKPPKVLDLFAGGGAIPLEATRLGCDATALELNPVAHLIELCTLDYPQRYGPALAEEVRNWGTWLIDRARSEVGHLYPELDDGGHEQTTIDGSGRGNRRVPIAYLWTRTVPCPNPAEAPHTVPLVRQTWLVKKSRRYVALKPVPDSKSMKIEYEVVESDTEAGLGFDPAGFSERGSTTCPLCGASVSLTYARDSIRAGKGGAELMAIGLLRPGVRGKSYVGSREAMGLLVADKCVDAALEELSASGLAPPGEPITDIPGHTNVYRYGLTTFGSLFTRRQLAMLLTLCRLVREAHAQMVAGGADSERAKAVATYLGLLVDRMSDRHSTLCTWDFSKEGISSTFARQALPMTWDYIEANPFGGSGGDLTMHVESIAKVIDHCARAGTRVTVLRGSATDVPFSAGEFDAVITDPPYYDNISYADLSDFFYVWLKRSIGDLYPEHLASELSPKRAEIIAAPYREGGNRDLARRLYEHLMASAFAEARRVLRDDGILVCVYAHQTTAGWSTLIEAVRSAGFVVVEAWPLDTEMPVRGVAQGTASLASSIFLVGRPRTESRTGDWAHEVRPELQSVVGARVDELATLGIKGTDLVIAAIGAGMRAYTRFERVEKPNGEELAPEEYLDEVQREVVEAILGRIFGTDRGGLGRVDQETQLYVMGRFEFGGAEVPWDELNTLARGTGVELAAETRGATALIEKSGGKARLRDFAERGEAIESGGSTIDHLHRLLWLAENQPADIPTYLAFARPDAERLRLVAHALSRPGLDATAERTPEADACERLLGSWRRLIEDNALTIA